MTNRPISSYRYSRVVSVVLVVLIVTSLASSVYIGTATSSPSESICQDPSQDIPIQNGQSIPADEASITASFSHINDSAIRVSYSGLNSTQDDFGPDLPTWLYDLGLRVRSTEGFTVHQSDQGVSAIWDESVPEPSIVFTTTAPSESAGLDDAGAVIQSEWAFFPLPPHSHPVNASIESSSSGFVGDQMLLFGEYTTYERAVECHDIEIYIPDAVEPAEPPNKIADSLAETAEHLEVGWKYETVRLYGIGGPTKVGGRAFTHEAWVHVDSSFTPEDVTGAQYPPRLVSVNVWTHEYIHTRQRWVTNQSVVLNSSWLTEAIASYYMVSETARQDRMSAYNETRYWARLNQSIRLDNRMVLTDPDTYQPYSGDYTRGAYIIAALDAEIRSQTGGEKSFDDVFWRLNQQEQITHASFRQAVIEVGGDELGPWMDRYVSGNETPPAPDPPLSIYWELLLLRADYQYLALMIGGLSVITFIALYNRYRC